MRPVTWEEVRARRLTHGHLLERAPAERLVDVVADVCGVHAQVMAAAELSIAARVADVTQADVRAALWERRELVKAPTHRGTLHLHPADEVPLWTQAWLAGGRDGAAWWFEEQGIEPERRRELEEAVERAVGAEPLTRAEVAEAVAAEVGEWAREPLTTSWNFVLPRPGMCYGPNRGRNVTFLRFEAWTGRPWRPPDPARALEWAARRFLRAYGPSEPAGFAHWSNLDPARAEMVLASLGAGEVELEGRRAFALADDAPGHADVASVRLLPAYDAYVVAARPRELLIPRERQRIFDRGAGPAPTLLVDGVVGGTWARTKRGRRLEVVVEPFARLTGAQRTQLDLEAERLGRFTELDPILRLGPLPG